MLKNKYISMLLLMSLSSVSMAGMYVGANIGSASIDDNLGFDESDTAYKFYIGGEINENFAIEGYYASFGEPTLTTGIFTEKYEITGIGLDLIGKLPVGANSKLFGSIGIFKWDEDYAINGVTVFEDDGTDLKAGLGFQHNFNPSLSLRLEYDAYFISDSVGDIDVGMFSAGLQFNF